MNLTEQKFWALIKDHLPGTVNRVENSTDDGMPDVNGTDRIDYWVELKVCVNDSKIRDVTKLLRDSQIVWNIRRGKFGAVIFVAVRYEQFIVLYRWDYDKFQNKLENIPLSYTQLAILRKERSFDWVTFSALISSSITERITNGLRSTGATG
jgi:hypothetical protein